MIQYIEKYGGKAAVISYDLMKVYDRVHLGFLYKVMEAMNFVYGQTKESVEQLGADNAGGGRDESLQDQHVRGSMQYKYLERRCRDSTTYQMSQFLILDNFQIIILICMFDCHKYIGSH